MHRHGPLPRNLASAGVREKGMVRVLRFLSGKGGLELENFCVQRGMASSVRWCREGVGVEV